MRVQVVGDIPLADTIRTVASEHHDLTGDPEVVWVCTEDIPTDIPGDCPVLVSSPFPVGSCRRLEDAHPGRWFAVCPENVREAHGREDFAALGSLVVGLRHWKDATWVVPLLSPFGKELLYMSPESAEMVKHAINAFLAVTIAFANEVAAVARAQDADPMDVTRGLLADARVGGYLVPGDPPGGHLMRDVKTLQDLGVGPLIGCL